MDLTRNFLQTVDPDQVKTMPQLKVLSMSHNQLYTIDFIDEPLFGLKILSLRNNYIIDLPRLLYMNVPSLTELDLSGIQTNGIF